MFTCAFWTLFIMCRLRTEWKRDQVILCMFMFISAIHHVGHCIFLNEFNDLAAIIHPFYAFADVVTFPLFYLYVRSITSELPLRHLWWVVFAPGVMLSLAIAVIYLNMTPEETSLYAASITFKDQYDGTALCHAMNIVQSISKIVFVIEVSIVMILVARCVKEFDHKVESFYSDTDDKTLKPFHQLLIVFTIAAISSFVFSIIGRHFFVESTWLLAVPSVIFSAVIFQIGWFGSLRTFTFEVQKSEEDAHDAIISQHTDELQKLAAQNAAVAAIPLSQRIEEMVCQHNMFLQKNLKVSDIASALNTNRLYVSQAINDDMHMSFSEYINHKRISYAIQLMQNNPQLNMTEVAAASGFSTDNSFYRNFKAFTGKTPKEATQSK